MDTFALLTVSDLPLYIALRMLFILVITLLVARVFSAATKNRRKEKLHLRLLFNIARVMIYALGIFSMLSQLPWFDGGVETLLAGSGIAA
ncbi:MAG: hypothetical protein LBU86_02065, partial [Oscillospiraceae bacterium]|nr:hypothetical protein [Oscillospiraceae bacterium]